MTEQFLTALRAFHKAAQTLVERWEPGDETIPVGLYPFKESFDQVALNIGEWLDDVEATERWREARK